MERYFELRDYLAETWDLAKVGGLAGVGPADDDAAAGGERPGPAAGDRLEARARADRLGQARRAAGGAPPVRGVARLRVGRGQPHPRHPPRPGQGAPRPGRASRAADAGWSGGVPGLGRGAAHERLRALPALPRAQRRSPPRVRVLFRGRRALRRPARRLRAGDEDGRGARGLRPPAGRARPARGRGVGAGDRRLVPARALPDRGAAGDAVRAALPVRVPRGHLADRPGRSTRSRRRSARRTSG